MFYCLLIASIIAIFSPAAWSFPEFQQFSEKNSGRSTDCAMCHTNSNGPSGGDEGQLDSLNQDQMARVNKARAALEPGQDVDSPILNEFGNKIIKAVGMKKILECRSQPAKLVEALGKESDIDKDGIPDSVEFAQGTDPLNKFHGDPQSLLVNNLLRYRFDIVLAIVATAAILFGLSNIIKGLNVMPGRDGRKE